jgi:hypothetical protein
MLDSIMRSAIRILALAGAVALGVWAEDKADLEVVHRIKTEAFNNSQVMDHIFWLTDVHGPRLTGSPQYKVAADWVVEKLKSWGLSSARLEKWGPFGRGWQNERFSAHLTAPVYQPLYGFPMAWTDSTPGAVEGEPVYAPVRSDADFEKWKGKLRGKIVLTEPMRELLPYERPLFSRYTDEDLKRMEAAPTPGDSPFRRQVAQPGPQRTPQELAAWRKKLAAFWRDEGAAVLVQYGYRGDGGTMAGAAGGSRDPKEPLPPAMIILTPEHYNRIARLLENKVAVRMEVEVRNKFDAENADSHNVVAELPGTGPNKEEVVILGGHLDSWHGGTGATDNASGVAVMMEALRILKTLNLKLGRTVRIALWGGEEQGLLGSRAYVKEHFADRETMQLKPAHGKVSAYYNIDNGTGKIRGIYLQGNDMCRPVFEAWLEPFRDLGVTTITARNTGGTDHQSFDAVGIPGFQFIQDPIEYSTRTHHSNMDVYDRIQRGDVMQMAAIVASLAYHTANRPEKLPRKPLPQPARSGRT